MYKLLNYHTGVGLIIIIICKLTILSRFSMPEIKLKSTSSLGCLNTNYNSSQLLYPQVVSNPEYFECRHLATDLEAFKHTPSERDEIMGKMRFCHVPN